MKKFLCLILALVMVLGLVACGNTTTPADDVATPDDTAAPAEAPKVVFMTRGFTTSPYFEEVKAGIEEYVSETYNIDFEMKIIEVGSYNDNSSLALASGEGWDIAFTNGTNFLANVGRNLFLPLDQYLEAGKLPTAQEVLPETLWQAGQYNGQYYGIFPTKDFGGIWNMLVNEQNLAEIGMEVPEWTTAADLFDWFEEAGTKWLELYPDRYAFPDNWSLAAYVFHDALLANNTVMGPLCATNVEGLDGFDEIGDTTTVFAPVLTDEYREIVKRRLALAEAGIFESYWPGENGYLGEFGNGEYIAYQGVNGYVSFDPNTYEGFTTKLENASTGMTSTGYAHAGFWVVNAKTENPEAVLDFAEALYSDEYLCTIMRFGLEGLDWTDNDGNGEIEVEGTRNEDPSNRSWYYWYGFEKSCVLTGKVAPGNGNAEDFQAAMWGVNDALNVSQNCGFVVDTTNITNEIAALSAVQQKYAELLTYPLDIGTVEDVDPLMDQLEADMLAAGLETVIAEVQAQLDAFHAAQ